MSAPRPAHDPLLDRCGALRALLGLILLALLLVGCGGGFSRQEAMSASESSGPPPPPVDANSVAAARDGRFSTLIAAADDASGVAQARRIIIYTADYAITVKKIEPALVALEALAEEVGGYVQRVDGPTIVLRVPVARYDEALEVVEGVGDVSHRRQEALDVTDDYVDLEARLRNARHVRARLEELLAQATNVTEALEVERELKRLGEEIERLEGQLELIESRAAYSTISVTLQRVEPQRSSFEGAVQLPFAWVRRLDPLRLWRGY